MTNTSVDLNIFTNCTHEKSDNATLITSTVNTMKEVFGDSWINNIRVFVDPQPKQQNLNNYVDNIVKDLKISPDNVYITDGLADGYLKSIHYCETDYIFQLEHDWSFLPSITHDMEFIIKCMKDGDMKHLRFNKRNNISTSTDILTEVDINGAPFCKTPVRSNNPHLIDRNSYISETAKLIRVCGAGSSDGIERFLLNANGFVYGCKGYEQQIQHTDGRLSGNM
jgi:hypothetical protein